MKNNCLKCDKEYDVSSLKLDSGYCPNCKPNFFSLPIFLQCSSKGTLRVWQYNLGLHLIMFLSFSLMTDGGHISIPGTMYCLIVMAYFFIRMIIGKIKGYPVLSKTQMYALLFLPVYGSVSFIMLFHFVQVLKH